MEQKRCWKCTLFKKLPDDFHKNSTTKDGFEAICKVCKKKDGEDRREKRAKLNLCHCGKERKGGYNTCENHVRKSRDWGRNNPEKKRVFAKIERERNKEIILNHYGKQCTCCKESRIEFLHLDHIKGGGNKHRREIKRAGNAFILGL